MEGQTLESCRRAPVVTKLLDSYCREYIFTMFKHCNTRGLFYVLRPYVDLLSITTCHLSLQVTCFATYAFAALFWAFPPGHRPTFWVIFTTVLSFLAPALAFLHILFSPLGKNYDIVREGESTTGRVKMFEKSQSFFLARKKVRDAQWEGSVCPGCCADRKVAWLTLFCPFCMFGYNMERLGFGNRYMHMVMFVIVLTGPLIIFWLASALVEDTTSKIIVWYTGLVVTVLGLTYGGAWRIRMRTTYKLPASRWACGSAGMTDVLLWIPCACCALCQEVRTADQYDIAMDSQSQAGSEDGAGEGENSMEGPVSVEEVEEGEEDHQEGDEEVDGEEDVERGKTEGKPTDAPQQPAMEK